MEKTFPKILTFDDFEIDSERRLLLKNGEAVVLNQKTFDLLLVLAGNRGEILSKNELLETVWEGQFVEENNLTVQISALRKIFGEKKGEHQFIVTIPGKGYKFVAGEISPSQTSPVAAANQFSKPAAKNFNDGEAIIGRAAEIAEIKNILREQNKCLLTLTGAGGSGKTTLARTIAYELQTEFEGGVFFVELAAVGRPELVGGAIAQALNLEESGNRSLLETLQDFLSERCVLLVLDNFEQLLSAASLLKELLDSAKNLRILVTSRAPLRLRLEQEKIVLPLAVPPQNSNLSAALISAFSAVELFALRAQTAKSSFALNDENALIIAEICNKLDGLPLAIELAAVRVRLLSPQAILARLENSLNLLTGGAKELPIRQRTMRGAIEWSYELLEVEEKVLFRRLAIFAGGFTAEAAESVVSRQLSVTENKLHITANERLTADVFNLLDSLINNNLLTCKELPDGNVRLRMLEVVREFALECLQSSGEYRVLRKTHGEYFLAFAEETNPYLNLAESAARCNLLEEEHSDLRAALGFLLETEVNKAARMAAAMWLFWYYHNHFTEGRRWLTAILKRIDADTDISATVRFRLFRASAGFAQLQGDYEAGCAMYEECIAIARTDNHLQHLALALGGLGMTVYSQGDFDAAQSLIEEGLAIHREVNDKNGIAAGLNFLGNLFCAKDDTAAARPFFEEALQLSRKLDNKDAISSNLNCLGMIAVESEDFAAARAYLTEDLLMAEELGNKISIAHSLDGFAALAERCKNPRLAAQLAGAAQGLSDLIGSNREPAERRFHENYVARTRATLDEKTFSEAFEKGRFLTLNESVSLVKVFDSEFVSGFHEKETEIIIETHQISRIVIEAEIKN